MGVYRMKNWRQRILLGPLNAAGYLIWGWSKIGARPLADIKPKNILVLQLDEIGDVLLSTPALRLLRQIYPESKIIVAARRAGYEILSGNPNIDQLILVDVPRLSASTKQMPADIKKIKQALPVIKSKLPGTIDLGIDLRADLRTIYLLKKLGAKQRVSQSIRGGGFWLTHIAPYLGLSHEVERKMGIIRYLSPNASLPSNLRLEIAVNEDNKRQAGEILAQNEVKITDKYAVYHPFAGWKPKEWPADRFVQIAKYLVIDYHQKVVIIGSAAEREAAEKIARTAGTAAVNLAGQIDLKTTAAVIAGATLFIGNDSGPMHIACAVETPVIALFGQNTPKRYGPWQNKNVTIYHPVECSPCSQTGCSRRPRCMEMISVDEVREAIGRILVK